MVDNHESGNWRIEVLSIIENVQSDRSGHGHGTASVNVKIGGTSKSNMVQHDKLYIEDCPGKVVETLQNEGYSLSMGDQGMCVRKPLNTDN